MADGKVLRKEQLERIINYYELNIIPHKEYYGEQGVFMDLVKHIIDLAKNKDEKRYFKFFEKSLLIQDAVVDPATKLVKGKIRAIRTDLFPELFNTINDVARDLDAGEDDGIVETTHFCIDYSKKSLRLALEFNYQGAKITDFANYLFGIGLREKLCENVTFTPIVKGNLEEEMKKISRCSEFVAKVHYDRVEEIKKLDKKLFTAFSASTKDFDNEYATVKLNFDYKNVAKTTKINTLIRKLGKIFYEDPAKGNIFEIVTVKAEDPEKGNTIQAFDLLLDKVRSKVLVLKKPKARIVVSEDMYLKIVAEMKRLKI
jgi:hypothetical protein